MNDFSDGSKNTGLIVGLQSEDSLEKLQALSTLFESLTYDSTAVFEYARPVTFLPLLIPLVELGQGDWELGGEIAFQSTRCLGLYLESAPQVSAEMIVQYGGSRFLVKWLQSLEQIEFAELAIVTLSSVVKEQHLALVTDCRENCHRGVNARSCEDKDIETEVNGILAILNVLDFLPIEIQKTAIVTVIKGCTYLPSKYWKFLKDAIPFVTSLIGEIRLDHVHLGIHAEGALKICVVALRSVAGPRGGQQRTCEGEELRDSVGETIFEMSSQGLFELTTHILKSSSLFEESIVEEVMEAVGLMVVGSVKVRRMVTSSFLSVLCDLVAKLASTQTPRSLLSRALMLMDTLLETSRENEASSGVNQVKIIKAEGVMVFGGTDGQGMVSKLEYGMEVPLILSWFNDSGQCQHLIGVPSEVSPIIELGETSTGCEATAVLGWVHGDSCLSIGFTSQEDDSSVVLVAEMGRMVGVVCYYASVATGRMVALKLLRRFLSLLPQSETDLPGDHGIAAVVSSTLTSGSTFAVMEAISILKSVLFNDHVLTPHLASRCHVLERHGALFSLKALAQKPKSNDLSELETYYGNKAQEQAAALVDQIHEMSLDMVYSNPMLDCCSGFHALLKSDLTECTDSARMLEDSLQRVLTLSSSLTPFEWKSSPATATLISFLTLDGDTSLAAGPTKQNRCLLFLRVALLSQNEESFFTALLRLLHECVASELLDAANLRLVLSKPLCGDQSRLSNAVEETPVVQPFMRGRIARRLAEFGVIRGGGDGKKEAEAEQRVEAIMPHLGQFGETAAMEILNHPFQVIAKLIWINPTKRRGNRRGRSLNHSLPMIIEPTTCLGSLVEHVIASAAELGLEIIELLSRSNAAPSDVNVLTLTIAAVEVGQFHFVYRRGDPTEKPRLQSVDSKGGLSLLHAIHMAYHSRNNKDSVLDDPISPSQNIWSLPHTLEFSINCEPIKASTRRTDDNLELGLAPNKWWQEGSALNQRLQFHLSSDLSIEQSKLLIGSSVLTELLVLIRLLREIVDHCGTYSALESSTLDSLRLDLLPSTKAWVNDSISQRFTQQLNDPLVLGCGCLPRWLDVVAKSVPCCLPLEVRQRWLHSTSFGSSHALRALHRQKHSKTAHQQREKDLALPPAASKSIVLVNRQTEGGVLSAVLRAYQLAKHRREGNRTEAEELQDEGVDEWERGVQLEASFEGEPGSGAGPTAEFFTLLSESFMTSCCELWRGELSESDSKEALFPRPVIAVESDPEYAHHCEMMGCLGWVLMQALQDGHLLDLPLALPLLSLLMKDERTMPSHPLLSCKISALSQIHLLDPTLANHITSLLSISADDGDVIEGMCLDWTLPGRPDVRLLAPTEDQGDVVTHQTLNLWVERVLEVTLLGDARGAPLVQSLREGAMLVADPRRLSCFSTLELESLLVGDSVGAQSPLGNDSNAIIEAIECAHGYTHTSSAVIMLVECLALFQKTDQVAFIRFVTGSPRLPLGGLSVLNPPLTVVKKHCTSSSSLDLPSASTCTNYLKLPDYGSQELLKSRLLLAIHEGQGAFFLS